MVRFILELGIAVMLVVTCADLLYLYYGGYWFDPIVMIERIEVLLLYLIGFVGLSYIVWRTRVAFRKG